MSGEVQVLPPIAVIYKKEILESGLLALSHCRSRRKSIRLKFEKSIRFSRTKTRKLTA